MLPGRKIQLGNSIGSQKTSPREVPNSDALETPTKWRILLLRNTICAMFQYKNQHQDYLKIVKLCVTLEPVDRFLSFWGPQWVNTY